MNWPSAGVVDFLLSLQEVAGSLPVVPIMVIRMLVLPFMVICICLLPTLVISTMGLCRDSIQGILKPRPYIRFES